ncbi:type IV pilus modification protein PilV [Halomonas salifodinae]|uniref:type IV pilus modification protein PilV n=1 Tax=Halomonas salifodinae TaxID=438745 RepID=UPI0033A61649
MDRQLRHCSQDGFTLLEALIAILVLSFGLLGVAAMQLKAMQSAHLSYHRSIATLAAQDAVERLWAAIDTAAGECPDPSVSIESDWIDHWDEKLPGMELSSEINLSSVCQYAIAVSWGDNRFGGESVSDLTYVVRLPGESP